MYELKASPRMRRMSGVEIALLICVNLTDVPNYFNCRFLIEIYCKARLNTNLIYCLLLTDSTGLGPTRKIYVDKSARQRQKVSIDNIQTNARFLVEKAGKHLVSTTFKNSIYILSLLRMCPMKLINIY